MPKKKERIKLELEFPIKCSPALLYNYISSASGLSEWFAHDVDNKSRNEFTFKFEDGEVQHAHVVKNIPNKTVRFKFDGAKDDEYLELDIIVDELTEDVALKVTEFCNEEDVSRTTELWQSEMDILKNATGG